MPKTERDITIGIPECYPIGIRCHFGQHFSKVWDTMYNYRMKVQERFMKKDYQQTSDTVCFPAKLVHGHLRNLVKKYHVDHIFMPSITTVPPENMEKQVSLCVRW